MGAHLVLPPSEDNRAAAHMICVAWAQIDALRLCAFVGRDPSLHALGMFVVTEAVAAAISAAVDQGGEFAAAVEPLRPFLGATDNEQARARARTIAGWKPLKLPPRPPT
jgi:hypothetical protein